MSKLETDLEFQLKALKVPEYEREYRFGAHHVGMGKDLRARLIDAGLKDWRFDFAFVELKLAVEVEGGSWSSGRHTRGKGFEDDCIKYGKAMELGWNVYRCTGGMIKSGQAAKTIAALIALSKTSP